MNAECAALTSSIANASTINIIVATKHLSDKRKLLWWVKKPTRDIRIIEVKAEDAKAVGACTAFREALSEAGFDFDKTPDEEIFTKSRWRKYYEKGKSEDIVYVFVINELKTVIKMLGKKFVFDPDPVVSLSLYRSAIKRAEKGGWWQKNWKTVLLVGGITAAVAWFAFREWKRKNKKETTNTGTQISNTPIKSSEGKK
jgi:hypothetical protein